MKGNLEIIQLLLEHDKIDISKIDMSEMNAQVKELFIMKQGK